MNDVTRILGILQSGQPQAAEELLPVVYGELRQLAARKLARELPGQTLQPTALVHEAWLRLVGDEPTQWNSRGHFFAAAAEAMRRILVERARRRQSLKRGAGAPKVELAEVEIAVQADDESLLLVHEALDRLAAAHPQAAELVKLRFFAGLGQQESARLMDLPDRSAGRLWAFARAWLFREIQREL